MVAPFTLLLWCAAVAAAPAPPSQAVLREKWPLWPVEFHAELIQNRSGSLALVVSVHRAHRVIMLPRYAPPDMQSPF